MTNVWHILAADDFGWGELIGFAALALFALIGHLAKRNAEKKEAERAEQKRRERTSSAPAAGSAPPQRAQEARAAGERQEAFLRQMGMQKDTARSTTSQGEPVQAVVAPAPHAQAPQGAPPPPPGSNREPTPQQVQAARRRRAARARRQQQLKAEAAKRRAESAAAMAARTAPEAPPPEVDLDDREALRQAIIYHEILSPPKGLRRQRELWDM